MFKVLNGEKVEMTAEEITEFEVFRRGSPQLVPVPVYISDRQFFQELANRGLITEAEAEDAVATGTIPPTLLAIVEGLAPHQQFAARMFLKGATLFERSHPMTSAIGNAYGMTPEEMDEFWRAAFAL